MNPTLLSLLMTASAVAPQRATIQPDPDPAAELLAADRGFATQATTSGLATAFKAMCATEVTMPIAGGKFADGVASVLAALNGGPSGPSIRATWIPIRVGVSADGRHGFTHGYFSIPAPGGSSEFKYLAYWIKHADGWRVAAYHRRPRVSGPVSLTLVSPVLPARRVAPVTDSAAIEAARASLVDAERSFSAEAQTIGLGPAFLKFGSPEAVNMGARTDPGFLFGASSIAKLVSEGAPGTPSSVAWSPDRVLVASSGDLGVSIGLIRPHQPTGSEQTAFAFFTIWQRRSPNEPWRYVAE